MKQFEKFIKKYGEGKFIKEFDLKVIDHIKDLFIPEIYTLLKRNGVHNYMDGFIWTLNPNDYIVWLNKWLKMEVICIPFARTAFGDIFFIVDKKIMILSVSRGLIDYTTNRVDWFFNRYLTDDIYMDKYLNRNLYYLLENKEELTNDECFGFIPILSLGGKSEVKNLHKIRMKEHLLILSQAEEQLTFFPH